MHVIPPTYTPAGELVCTLSPSCATHQCARTALDAPKLMWRDVRVAMSGQLIWGGHHVVETGGRVRSNLASTVYESVKVAFKRSYFAQEWSTTTAGTKNEMGQRDETY